MTNETSFRTNMITPCFDQSSTCNNNTTISSKTLSLRQSLRNLNATIRNKEKISTNIANDQNIDTKNMQKKRKRLSKSRTRFVF